MPNNKKNNKSGKPGGNNKDKNKKLHPGGKGGFQFKDLTAERHFNSQKNKALKLVEEENFDEALDILEPLVSKHGDKAELFDLLAMCYLSLDEPEEARDALERVIALSPKNQPHDQLVYFNLAHMYIVTGYPLLGAEQLRKLDRQELEDQLEDPSAVRDFREFLTLADRAIEDIIAEQKLPREVFIRYGTLMERAQLALERGQTVEARPALEEALRLDDTQPAPYNMLALCEMVEGRQEEAINRYKYVLEKLEPDNVEALADLARIYFMDNQREEAQTYFNRLKALPARDDLSENGKIAEALAFIEDDQAIYDRLAAIYSYDPESEEETSDEFNPADLDEQTLVLAMVAALHLDKREDAEKVAELVEGVIETPLLERTLLAVENMEEGPLPEGRFFYMLPLLKYPAAGIAFAEILEEAIKNLPNVNEEMLDPFFARHGRVALEVVLFNAWSANEAVSFISLMSELIRSKVEGGLETVQRFAFTKAGSEPQRVAAANLLVEEGLIARDAEVQIWLNGQQRTGTVAVLTEEFNREMGLDEEDFEEE